MFDKADVNTKWAKKIEARGEKKRQDDRFRWLQSQEGKENEEENNQD